MKSWLWAINIMQTTSICCISDTHGQHSKLTIPPCDVLIHAGDCTLHGRPAEALNFLYWFLNQPAEHLIITPGNHDFCFEDPNFVNEVQNCGVYVLIDNLVKIRGLNFYGQPNTSLPRWAFGYERGSDAFLRERIPLVTDVLITHEPPNGILDKVNNPRPGEDPNVGSVWTLKRVLNKVKPMLHVFGHIHEQAGMQIVEDTIFVNAAVLNDRYEQTNDPVLVLLSH